jgi:hypothetical protein
MDLETLDEQIAETKAIIKLYNAAIKSIVTDGMQTYTLDSGQTRQVVTKLTLSTLRTSRQGFTNELCTLQARRNGSGSMTGRAAW